MAVKQIGLGTSALLTLCLWPGLTAAQPDAGVVDASDVDAISADATQDASTGDAGTQPQTTPSVEWTPTADQEPTTQTAPAPTDAAAPTTPQAAPAPAPAPAAQKPAPKTDGPNVVKVHKDVNGYKLIVDGEPTMVFGMNWGYMPIGENYNYNFWGKSDAFIKEALDNEMSLLQEMGVNAIRQYVGIPQRWITYIYEKYGIYTLLNHPVARWGMTIDGAWVTPTDYSDPRTRELVLEEIDKLVRDYKDTPGLMMWLLGNENNYGLYWKSAEIEDLPEQNQSDARAKFLYSLFGEITDKIHSLDKNHPVSLTNGDLGFIDVIKQECPQVDIFGSNVYRGKSSRDIFERVHKELGMPFMYTEFGSDAYNAKLRREDDLTQAQVLRDQWQEIYEQSYGKGRVQNAIGGVIFQWSDGWWKYKQEENLDVHDTTASWSNEAYPSDFMKDDNNMNEEWFGIAAKGPSDKRGIYPVYPRTAYYLLKEAFKLDPYAQATTVESVRQHFGRLGAKDLAHTYAAASAQSKLAQLERARISQLRIDFETYTTGGRGLSTPEREPKRFDHTESVYFGVEVKPTNRVKGEVVVNGLGNVAENPIDEIFFENRGQSVEIREENGKPFTLNGIERFKVYSASLEWDSKYFHLEGFHRGEGHYHWGHEGDFFTLYPEAHYQHDVDLYNANAPTGIVFTGKKKLDGFKLAFGPELYWGANPSVIGKYYRDKNDIKFSLMHQEDIARQNAGLASSAIPQPVSRKTTIYVGLGFGKFTLDMGGVMAGTKRIGRPYQAARKSDEPTYLESGYNILDGKIRFGDTLGGRVKLQYNGAPFFWYLQGGYRGLVADAGTDPTLTITGWSMKESGQGNHWAVSTGAAYYMGSFVLAPNLLFQKPLEGPLPSIGDHFDAATGRYFPGVNARNQFEDPFWVRSNRETYGLELLLAFDPTPATFMWAWDNLQREDAKFSAVLDFVYRFHPTSQDAGVAVAAEGFSFAFGSAPPAKDLWDISLRSVTNFTHNIRLVNWLYAGQGQARGDDPRTVRRFGTYGWLTWDTFQLNYHLKFDDWGPYDYHKDFNLTFPLQVMLDLSYGLTTPKLYAPAATRFGVRGKFRSLDNNSARFRANPDDPGRNGREWEVKTYVQLSL